MSIFAQLNLFNGQWTTIVQPESSSPVLEIGFVSDTALVEFDNLTFGYACTVNTKTVAKGSYPVEGVIYVSTDQPYIVSETIFLNYDDDAILTVWAKNAGQEYSDTVTFTVPRPDQPYPSWAWNGEWWEPPVPYPDDGGRYEWDEEGQQWATVDPISEQGDD